MRPRETYTESVAEQSSAKPGPGNYTVGEVPFTHRGAGAAAAMLSKTKRFKQVIPEELPGAGQYNVSKPLGSSAHQGHHGAPPRASHHIKFTRKVAPSSVPSRQENLGYRVNGDGSLMKEQPNLASAEDIGPGRYDVAASTGGGGGDKYKGMQFGKRTGPRFPVSSVSKLITPAPSDYYTDSDSAPATISPRKAVSAPFSTHSPRKLVGDVTTEAPGPGTYTLPDPEAIRNPPRLQCFNSTSRRFVYREDHDAPPVGAYDDPRRAFEIKSVASDLVAKQTPFNQSSARFPVTYKRGNPGPNQYAIDRHPAFSINSRVNSKINYYSPAAFGSTDRRGNPFSARDAYDTPAPGEHQHSYQADQKDQKDHHKPAASYASKTPRLLPLSGLDTPAPTAYYPPIDESPAEPGTYICHHRRVKS